MAARNLVGTRVIQANSDTEIAHAAREGACALEEGELVAFATETVYGVAALAGNAAAMERLRELKDRPQRPFSVHLGRPGDAARYVGRMPAIARRLIAKAWPGPLTLLVGLGGGLADEKLQAAGMYDVLAWEDFIGLRCPDCRLASALLAAVDWPVVAPSANLAGAPSPRTAQDVLAELDGRIDLLIDSGPTRYGLDSTIVRVDAEGWKIVREGVYSAERIRRLLRKTFLFVCTGNTCRSPIAAGLARKLLAGRLGCPAGQLDRGGFEILSAGVLAREDGPPSPEALAAAERLGVDISRHRSRKLTVELINQADVIFCMTDSHVAEVLGLVPDAVGKVSRLWDGGDISDPIGGGQEVYRGTADRIDQSLRKVIDEHTYEDRASG
jgi:protein-tyrosine phosphatase